jgi:hypothetical protein
MIVPFCDNCARLRDPGENLADWQPNVNGEGWICPECKPSIKIPGQLDIFGNEVAA